MNLAPGFQRQSVWTERDRANLIKSILRNYPLPAIFLYKREDEGHLVFDVIDGKQRMESMFMFEKIVITLPKVEIFGKTEALIAALENKKAVRTDGVLTAVGSWLPGTDSNRQPSG